MQGLERYIRSVEAEDDVSVAVGNVHKDVVQDHYNMELVLAVLHCLQTSISIKALPL